jgi:hypothetical protein
MDNEGVRMAKLLTCISAICLITQFGYSLTSDPIPSPSKPSIPVVQMNENNEVEIIFDPQRIAVVSFRENRQESFDMTLKIRSSSCQFPTPKIDCTMTNWFKTYDALPVWKVNPDKQRIGKVLKVNNSDISESSIIYQTNMRYIKNIKEKNKLFSEVLERAEPSKIKCSDYSWLPSNITSINEMSYEYMIPSTETGLVENKSIASVYDVQLQRNSAGISLTNIRPYYSSNPLSVFSDTFPLVATLMGWTYRNQNNICSVYFEREVNLASIGQNIQDSMTAFTPLKAKSIEALQKQLTQQNDNQFSYRTDDTWLFEKNQSSEMRILLYFRIANIAYENPPNEKPKLLLEANEVQ